LENLINNNKQLL